MEQANVDETVNPDCANVEDVCRTERVHFLAPVRAGVRFVAAILWSVVCCMALWSVAPVGLVSNRALRRARKAVSRTWIRGALRLIGTRMIVKGAPPSPPFFLVCNHLSWIDFFGVFAVVDAVGIVEAPIARIPIMGALMKGLEPIFVRRVKDDTARVNDRMVAAIQGGRSLVLAPETPVTTFPRGSGVKMFRGGLLASAVRTGTPVHYMSLTYRTPAGYPPPSRSIIFGPNPLYRTPDGQIPESELKAYGPERSFLRHLLGVLALPYQELTVTFGDEPIEAGTDRIVLANRLHDAVEAVFVPIT